MPLLVAIGHIAPGMAFPFISYWRAEESTIIDLACRFLEQDYLVMDGDTREVFQFCLPARMPAYTLAVNPSAYKGIGGIPGGF